MEVIMKLGLTLAFLSLMGCLVAMGVSETRTVDYDRRKLADRIAGWLGISTFLGVTITITSWIWM